MDNLKIKTKPSIHFFSVFNWTPIHYAAFKGFPEIIELLLNYPQIDFCCQTISLLFLIKKVFLLILNL